MSSASSRHVYPNWNTYGNTTSTPYTQSHHQQQPPGTSMIQLSQHHLNHLHSQTLSIRNKLNIVDSRMNARKKTKNSIFERQQLEIERRLASIQQKYEESRERNAQLESKFLSSGNKNPEMLPKSSNNSKIELEVAKTQFMKSISESFHELETEERKRKIRMLRETEERIRNTENMRKKAREQWHEEMMIKQAIAQKEVQLKLAEEEARKEALERQMLRKKFEDEQNQKRRTLEDQAAIAMEQFRYREESSRGAAPPGTDSNTLQKELSRIYDRPTSELRVSNLDSIPPNYSKYSDDRGAQYSNKSTAQRRGSKPPHDENYSSPVRQKQPEVPHIQLSNIPKKALSDSFSESNMTVTEDEASMVESRKPSDDSVYYQDGYSTLNESAEHYGPPSTASYAEYKRSQQRQKSQNHSTVSTNQKTKHKTITSPPRDEDRISESTHRSPPHRKEQHQGATNAPPSNRQSSRTLDIGDGHESSTYEESIDEEPALDQQQKDSEGKEDNDFMKAFRQSLRQETPVETPEEESHPQSPEPVSPSEQQRVQTPPPEMIDSARKEKESKEKVSIYSPSFGEDTKPSSPENTLASQQEEKPSTTPSDQPQQQKDTTSKSPTIPTESSQPTQPSEEKTPAPEPKQTKKKSLFSRLKKSRTKRSPKRSESQPTTEELEKSESEPDYYTTESGSEAPQSIFERKACSQVRRHLQSTFPVKIVMGLKELAASIEEDMSKHYTKGTLSSRLRKRNTSTKYPFPYEKRYAGRESPLRDYDGSKRVALIEAAIDSDEEVLEQYPYPIKSEILLDIIKYTPSIFITKQLYERLFDPDAAFEEWTPEFLEQKAQIRGPTLEMWKVIISHIKFLYKTDSSKKNQVVSAFAAVLTPRPSAKLGTAYIQDRDETVERVKKLIKYACGAKKKNRLSLGGSGRSSKKKSTSSDTKMERRKSSPQPQAQAQKIRSSLAASALGTSTGKTAPINRSKSSGIILGGRKPGGLGGGFGSSGSILDRLKAGQDLESDEDDDEDLNVTVFQTPASSGFGLGGVSFGNNAMDNDDDEYDEFDL